MARMISTIKRIIGRSPWPRLRNRPASGAIARTLGDIRCGGRSVSPERAKPAERSPNIPVFHKLWSD
jgi:hypothetical protein